MYHSIIHLSEKIERRHTAGGVKSGYAPHHQFASIPYLVSGRHDYVDDSYHFHQETLVTRIAFASWEDIRALIHAGDHFDIRELDRVIGSGVMCSIDA